MTRNKHSNLLFQKVTFQKTNDHQLLRLSAHLQSDEYFPYHTLGVRTVTYIKNHLFHHINKNCITKKQNGRFFVVVVVVVFCCCLFVCLFLVENDGFKSNKYK